MEPKYVTTSIVEIAYDIIAMDEENVALRQQLKHYKAMHESHLETIKQSDAHNMEMTGLILSAAVDPESAINKGKAALLREKYREDEI